MSRPRVPAPVLAAFAVLTVAFAAFVASTLGAAKGEVTQDVLYIGLLAGACLLCLARACVGRDRLVWLLLGAGLLCWVLGEVYWHAVEPEGMSPADAGYLAFYAFELTALVVLVHRRASGTLATLWADGLVAALTVGALAAYFFVEPVIAGTGGSDLAYVLVNLAYPIGDTVLLAFVTGAAVATRGSMRSSWLALSVFTGLMGVCDGIYLKLMWAGTYADGTLLDAGWPAAGLGLAWTAWSTYAEDSARRPLAERAPIVWPVLWGACSLILLAVLALVDGSHPIPIALAVAGVASVLGRLMLTDAQNRSLAAAASVQALTDPVTGLGNHRALNLDLEDALATTPPHRRVLVAVYDLNGFKAYNDHFGHPAGDALLKRIGGRLAAAVEGVATAYRMGGDEFCAIAVVDDGATHELLLARIGRALGERGDAFTVTAAGGHLVAEPGKTRASAALSTADERMFAAKRDTRDSPLRQTSAVLAAALDERDGDPAGRVGRIARLAELTARRLDMGQEDVAHVRHATRLRDVGKLAIPSDILDKPTVLDGDELQFLHTHTLVGERIACAAPSLVPVARLIRASHERYDGAGYPDGIAGADIPLGARIVFVCDAFDGMTSDRAHRPAMSESDALAELSRNAGTQFDPTVVRAFTSVVATEEHHGDAALAA